MQKILTLFEQSKTSVFYDHIYRPFFEKIQKYIPLWIHPNMITISSFIIINLIYIYELYYNNLIFTIGILSYWILDNLDGIHARASKQTSAIGEILDHCGDSYMFIIIFEMVFNILNNVKDKIIDNNFKIIIFITFVCMFDLFHVYHKYTNKMTLGYKLFTIDEVFLLIPIFINLFNYQLLSNEIIKNIMKLLFVSSMINNICILYKIINNLNNLNYNNFIIDIIILCVVVLSYPIFELLNIQYLVPSINLIYVFSLITRKIKII